MTYKINYDSQTTLVLGKYPSAIYENAPEPNITISDAEYKTIFGDGLFQTPCIVNGVIQEFVIPDSEILQEAKTSKLSQCKSYLSSTDWYAIRKADNGTVIPTQIEKNRELARTLQDDINACTTIEELNAINIDF